MVVHELPFPLVWEDGVQAGYGGNQEWFLQVFQRTAGCASVTGANLAAYYASRVPACHGFYSGDIEQFSKSEYLRAMEEMYRYMTPGPMGFPVAGKFVRQFLLFAEERGGAFRAHKMFHRSSCEERMAFIKEAIVAENPVAFLILRHRAPEMKENNWHWVTITGWIEDAHGEQVIVSNCGEREVYPAEMLFENHRANVLRLAWFFFE